MNSKWIDIARKRIPPRLRYWIQRHVSLTSLKTQWRADTTPFSDILQGASRDDGKPVTDGAIRRNPVSTARWKIPRLFGEFEVTRGPYLGETKADPATVWVFRPVPTT